MTSLASVADIKNTKKEREEQALEDDEEMFVMEIEQPFTTPFKYVPVLRKSPEPTFKPKSGTFKLETPENLRDFRKEMEKHGLENEKKKKKSKEDNTNAKAREEHLKALNREVDRRSPVRFSDENFSMDPFEGGKRKTKRRKRKRRRKRKTRRKKKRKKRKRKTRRKKGKGPKRSRLLIGTKYASEKEMPIGENLDAYIKSKVFERDIAKKALKLELPPEIQEEQLLNPPSSPEIPKRSICKDCNLLGGRRRKRKTRKKRVL